MNHKSHLIQDNMLFINGQYIRDISKEEAKRLDTFEKQYHKYMDYLEQVTRWITWMVFF